MTTACRAFVVLVFFFVLTPFAARASNTLPALAYGPAIFTRHSRDVTTATATFALPPLIYAPYSLFVVAPPDQGVVVQLNGTTVLGDGVRDFPLTVTLQAQNTLDITLPSRIGESVFITILGYQYAFSRLYQELPVFSPESYTDDVDWRTKGAVTPVQDEGSCASDWAFSATGAAAGEAQIRTGNLYSLSAQELLDCVPRHPRNCADGNPVSSLQYILQNGDESSADYPYTATVGVCSTGSTTPQPPAFSTIQWIQNEQALGAAVNQGPVSVVLNSNWFSTYTTGVATPDCSSSPPVFTGALVVGYTSTSWIVKASLGTSWGMQGYFELARGQDACGIGDMGLMLGN